MSHWSAYFGCTRPQCDHFLYFQQYKLAYALMFFGSVKQLKQCKQQCEQKNNIKIECNFGLPIIFLTYLTLLNDIMIQYIGNCCRKTY